MVSAVSTRLCLVAIVALSAVGSSACRTVRAATPVERPNLEVPPPPPRIIEPAPAAEPPPEPTTEPPPATASVNRPKPPVSHPKPDVKPDVPPETPPATTTPPPSGPPPQLRTPGMASGPEAARQVQAILDRASGMLNSVNQATLSRERRNSFQTARRFMEEAEREMRASNYVLAREYAEKAERLAKELQGR